jgi:putative oxidoreductase
MTTKTNGALLLGRILMSAIFVMGGLSKLLAFAGMQQAFGKMGLPVPALALTVAIVIELAGGLALLVGFATQPVAVVLGLWCVATALVAHTHFADQNMQIHFMKNLAMAGGFAYVAVFGAGSISIDARRAKA